MAVTEAARVLLCAPDPAGVSDLRRLLEQAGFHVAPHALGAPDPGDLAGHYLVVLDGSGGDGEALRFCRRLRARPGDSFLPVLFVTDDRGPDARMAGLEAGADACLLRPLHPGEVVAQARALLRVKEVHDRLAEKTAEARRAHGRLRQAYQQIDRELELARRVQRSLLPRALPEVPGCRFAVHHAPRGQAGGDFYDVFRLDEEHVGCYVADAVGHGAASSLLTVFVKNGVRAKDVTGRQYRLVPPGEVLRRLNRELVAAAVAEAPFITMAYVLLNHRRGTVQLARAGHPHPLHLPADGPPRLWQVEGSLMGVFDTEFHAQGRALGPGDRLLLYSDGIDAARLEDRPEGIESLLACAERHRALPLAEYVERLARDLFAHGGRQDDLTLLALETLGT